MNNLRDLIKECELCAQSDSVYIAGDKSDGLVAYNKTNNQALFRIRMDHHFVSYDFECREYCISQPHPSVLANLYQTMEQKYYEQSISFLKNQMQKTSNH